jgi:antitoxin MazE
LAASVASGRKIGQAVDVREEDGYVVIEPVTVDEYDLASLFDAITPENGHKKVDFGVDIG